jgi:alkylhydroperoxidase family enzyme
VTLLQDVEWEACLLEPHRDRALERQVRRELGGLPFGVPYFAASPWIVHSLVAMSSHRVRLVYVDLALADVVGLVVSQDNSCRFCYATQRMLMRLQGLSEARIRQLEGDLLKARLAPRERVALEFARTISRASPLAGDGDKDGLRAAGWPEAAIRELAFLAAAHVYFNRIHTLPAIPPERGERFASHWSLPFLAPLVGRLLRARFARGQVEPLPEDMRNGPYSYLVLALDGLPAARALRRLLDDAWASPLLAHRTKALIFAVIARGLGCAFSEQEASRLLREDGLSAEEIATILDHLGSPALNPMDAAIVPFARETIRCRPIEIQRRARALREKMPAGAFLEVLGVAALANAVCRLGVVVPAR